MDVIDCKLLELLQVDVMLLIVELVQCVNLLQMLCWKCVQWLKEIGVICVQVVLCDLCKFGVGMIVFVVICMNQYIEEWVQCFMQVVCDMLEVVEVYWMSGEIDYLLCVVVVGIDDYDCVYK